jgi:hypothetical protein
MLGNQLSITHSKEKTVIEFRSASRDFNPGIAIQGSSIGWNFGA